MIRLNKVNKYFNKNKKNEIHVINDTTISFPKQGLIALLGPSGSGKTTLLNVIGGLDKVTGGSIYIGDERVSKRRVGQNDKIRNAKIGYIFQNYNLLDNKSVFDNVAIVLKMIGIKDKEEISKRVEYALDLVGMYRYRNRYANMLSGGERQRVGIARAIVKNPSIIIADEPTGNLDSKNTLEVMNIIKSISKEKLVILVTHEEKLAEFYADRTVKLLDGKVVSDQENIHENDLDYRLDNRIYLKDIKHHEQIESKDRKIDIYYDEEEEIRLNIITKGDNVYIQCLNDDKHMEIIDEHSPIEVINDNYREITKEEQEKNNFDASKLGREGDGRHSSILSIPTAIVNGFKTIRDYSILKKILLVGFFISAIFIVYSISNIAGVTDVKDYKFVTDNKDYLRIKSNNVAVNDYDNYEKETSVEYLLPGQGHASFKLNFDDYLQTYGRFANLDGSLSSSKTLSKDDLITGRLPENNNEIVIDKLVFSRLLEDDSSIVEAGIDSANDLLGRPVELNFMPKFTIVGITDNESPCIYADPELFINILANSNNETDERNYMMVEPDSQSEDEENVTIIDVNLLKKNIKLEKGRMPKNDYEILVNELDQMEKPIGKEVNEKVNGHKLKVVGYYSSRQDGIDYMLTTENTVKINLIKNNSDITVYPKDKGEAISALKSENANVVDVYEYERENYSKEMWSMIQYTVVMGLIMIVISFIEILLMMRASFLSRIKEIGTLRAIGVKKSDIYKIFAGEIVAITTVASLPGYLFMSYIVNKLSEISFFKDSFMMDWRIFIIGIAAILLFNIIVGLLPVFLTMRKTPAAILARTDIN